MSRNMPLKRLLAKIYIWLIPILSVPVMFFIKNTFDRQVFLIAIMIHLLLVVLSLSVVSRASQCAQQDYKENQFVAILLIVGATLTFLAASTFKGTSVDVISSYKFEHYWTSAGFLLASFVSLAGALLLLLSLKEKTILSSVSFLMLLVGTILWIVHLAFRLTVMVWVADNALNDDAIRNTYTMINSLSVSFYVLFMVLCYVAFAGFSLALIKSGLIKGWVIKLCVLFGTVAPIFFATGAFVFGMPITGQVIPFLIGVKLLERKGFVEELDHAQR